MPWFTDIVVDFCFRHFQMPYWIVPCLGNRQDFFRKIKIHQILIRQQKIFSGMSTGSFQQFQTGGTNCFQVHQNQAGIEIMLRMRQMDLPAIFLKSDGCVFTI